MTEEKALTISAGSYLMPVFGMEQAIDRYNRLVEFVRRAMKPDIDFGKIPGSDKATLLKPGAERLTTYFGLTPRFVTVKEIEDWTGRNDSGEPFFYYWFRCQLWRGDILVAEADGSCNSHEKKYRYRQGERICPKCHKTTIRKSKQDRGGWYCWAKLGGCGALFKDGDQTIEGQEVGQILNPDIADQANTILKMAQKRALIAATLMAVNASEFFTQDLEDLDIVEGHYTPVNPMPPAPEPPKAEAKSEPEPEPEPTKAEWPKPTTTPAKPKVAIKTGKWNAAAIQLATDQPYYQTDGQPNFYKMLNAAGKHAGVTEITDQNLPDVIAALTAHAVAEMETKPGDVVEP